MSDTPNHAMMTDEELEARMDAFFVREFGKAFRPEVDEPPALTLNKDQADSLQRIMKDFSQLFDSPKSGNA